MDRILLSLNASQMRAFTAATSSWDGWNSALADTDFAAEETVAQVARRMSGSFVELSLHEAKAVLTCLRGWDGWDTRRRCTD